MKKGTIEKKTLSRRRKRQGETQEGRIANIIHPKIPFPVTLEANTPSPFTKKGVRMDKMMELFKQVKINLPLLHTIKQVSSYAKFQRSLHTKTQVPKMVLLTQQVSAILMNELLTKPKDLGAPIISCVIGDLKLK